MKVITYVKRGIDKPFIKIEHAVRKNYSANEEFEYWCKICERAMKTCRIVDYQVELVDRNNRIKNEKI